jgi:Phytanoyl-CoA dioxygenase (PhyH)
MINILASLRGTIDRCDVPVRVTDQPAAFRSLTMNLRHSSWLLAPVHAAALLSAAKSFRDNPILGNAALNRAGLHVLRVRLAAAMAASRRRRLQHLLSERDLADFHRDGFVLKQDYLPAASFRALEDEVAALAAPAREMIQGDAVTRRIALDAQTLATRAAVRAFVEDPYWLALIRYAASSALTPLTYVQTIFSRVRPGAIDPQTLLHADTFHSTVKAWFFLTDVAADAGPFVYVPGSHRLTPERLEWERQMSLVARRSDNNETQEGSFRVRPNALGALGLPQPRRFAVPANTLIVADTMGFHARGTSGLPSVRIEIWAYGRRNPFLPWVGWDPVAMPLIRGRAVPFFWAASDVGERLGLGRNPWRPAGVLTPDAPASLHLFN